MKKLLLFCCMLLATSAFSQSGKVKKEKTVKQGIVVKGGMASYSIDGWDCDAGFTGEVYWSLSGLLKPKNTESHWAFETGLGIDFSKSKAVYSGRKRGIDEDIFCIGLFTIPCNAKYILNPLSTRGKWIVKAGIDFCPLEIGVPQEKEGKAISSYYHLESTVGMKIGIDGGLGYEGKHWGLYAGGFGGMMTPWSSEASLNSGTMAGFYASLHYFF